MKRPLTPQEKAAAAEFTSLLQAIDKPVVVDSLIGRRKTEKLTIYVTPAQKELIKRVADEFMLPVGGFMTAASLEIAKEAVKRMQEAPLT